MQIVSLTTDFGTRDYYVAELKGILLTKNNLFNIVDISHEVNAYDIVQGAFFVKNVIGQFPPGTIHIVAVNNNYHQESEYICFKKHEQYFIGPNNGLFTLVFDQLQSGEVFQIRPDYDMPSHYYHLYAYAADYISRELPIDNIGPAVSEINEKLELRPVVTTYQIRATIIHVDAFDNVIINLRKEQFEKVRAGRDFELYYKQHDPITTLNKTYSDVAPGETVIFFNTAGFLEIAVNLGNASTAFNLNRNETIQINFL